MRQLSSHPWQLGLWASPPRSADYRAARGGRPPQGSPVAAVWDPELRAAMVAGGRAVHEEEVLEGLLGDLADAPVS